MKIGGMGEQAIRVQFYELRRLHELPEEVQILAVLPDLPEKVKPLHSDWVPHRRPSAINARCLYVHVQHRYCFRGAEQGAPLIIEDFDEFLKRFQQLAADELAAVGKPVPGNHYSNSWVEDDVP